MQLYLHIRAKLRHRISNEYGCGFSVAYPVNDRKICKNDGLICKIPVTNKPFKS